jgi:hypothetical protein
MTRLGAIISYMLSSQSLSIMVMVLPMPDMYMFAIILQEGEEFREGITII